MKTQFESRAFVGVACTLLTWALSGCSSTVPISDEKILPLDRPAFTAASKEEASQGSISAPDEHGPSGGPLADALALSRWVLSPRTIRSAHPHYRWVYPALEELFSDGSASAAELQPYLSDPDPIVAANAAVMLLRLGDLGVASQLAEAAGNVRLDRQLRCAAAEALGYTATDSTAVRRLVNAEAARPAEHFSPAIHAELLLALGRVGQRSPEAFDCLLSALRNRDLGVRSAAISAMGSLGDQRGVAHLQRFLESGGEAERIAAVGALAAMGKTDAIAAAARDDAWRVRLAVAEVLPQLPGESSVALAERLLEDTSAEVQHETVAAIGKLPAAVAEPLLIDALEKCPYRSQKLAAELLSSTWPEAKPLLDALPFGQSPASRAPAIAEIRRAHAERNIAAFEQHGEPSTPSVSFSDDRLESTIAALQALQTGGADRSLHAEATTRLRREGPELIDKLEYLVEQRGIVLPDSLFVDVLAAELPEFADIERLQSEYTETRRDAARKLAEQFTGRRPRPLLLHRLADLTATETDAVVWQYLLAMLQDLNDEQTFRMVYAAAVHESSGIRRAACEHLGRYPDPRHVPVLTAALDDTSAAVVCAAVDALAGSGGKVDHARIVQLLGRRSDSIRLAAAVALARLGRPEGPDALERMAYSSSNEVRLQAAQAMGQLGLPQFAPTLIALLDDRHGIRVAALDSLSKIADCEEAESGDLRESERVEAWRKWAKETHGLRLEARRL